jgi:hypothetical protein
VRPVDRLFQRAEHERGVAAAALADGGGAKEAGRRRRDATDVPLHTLIAPADSPKIVTCAGSPPNALMLACTHRIVAC